MNRWPTVRRACPDATLGVSSIYPTRELGDCGPGLSPILGPRGRLPVEPPGSTDPPRDPSLAKRLPGRAVSRSIDLARDGSPRYGNRLPFPSSGSRVRGPSKACPARWGGRRYAVLAGGRARRASTPGGTTMPTRRRRALTRDYPASPTYRYEGRYRKPHPPQDVCRARLRKRARVFGQCVGASCIQCGATWTPGEELACTG